MAQSKKRKNRKRPNGKEGRRRVEAFDAENRERNQQQVTQQFPDERTTERYVKEAAAFVCARNNLFVEYVAAERGDWLDKRHIDGCFLTKNSLAVHIQIKTGKSWVLQHFENHPHIFAFSPKAAMARGETPEQYSFTLEKMACAILENRNRRTPYELFVELEIGPFAVNQSCLPFGASVMVAASGD